MSDATYRRLIEAGAPELPDGLFYRIERRDNGFIRVGLRKRGFIGSTRLAHEDIDLSWYGTPDSAGKMFALDGSDEDTGYSITELCAHRCRSLNRSFKAREASRAGREALTEEIDSLLGDHP